MPSPDPVSDPDSPGRHWFADLADYMGPAYLRYSFTKGTVREVDALVDRLALTEGMRILDVGCGPGRHSHELARRGLIVHGVDISEAFVALARSSAPPGATFDVCDARQMRFVDEFDAAICLCQGAFGLMTDADDDRSVLAGVSRALRPGGRLALTAFNAYFAVKYHDAATFDADRGISHERTEIRNEDGVPREVSLWTGCYTPRELRLLLATVDLEVESIECAAPGEYGHGSGPRPPSVETPEHLVIASKSSSHRGGSVSS